MSYPNGGYDQNNGDAPYGGDPHSQGSANQYGQHPESQPSANQYGQYPGSQPSAADQYGQQQGGYDAYGQGGNQQGGGYPQQGGGYPQQGGGYDAYGQGGNQQQGSYQQQGGHQQQGGGYDPNQGGYPEPAGFAGGVGAYGATARPSVSLPQAMKLGFKNYANFYGRASKSEFWYWVLFYVIAAILVGIVGSILNSAMGFDPTSANMGSGETNPAGILSGLFGLALLLPWLAVGARRMHDTNRSGWLMALQLIPIVGIIIVLVMGNGESKPEGARFDNPDGSQPKLP